MPIAYQFLPWARRGLAVALAQPDTLNATMDARASAAVGVTLATDDGATHAVPAVTMQLHGPGDVMAIDTSLVVRTDPRPGATDYEPNYLAQIEFDPPDFPWMLTPAAANADDRLRPWLVLVVLRRDKVGLPKFVGQAPLPQVRIAAPDVAAELPSLADSWSWAHAQVVSDAAANDTAAIQADLQADPRKNISRLISPRRLEPNTAYLACVVPAFRPGVLRGLGQAGDGSGPGMAKLAPAWDTAAAQDVVLPVYHHWEFATGAAGDFEALARRLRSPKKWKGDAAMTALLGSAGTAPMSIDPLVAGFGVAAVVQTTMEGALVPIKYTPGERADEVHESTLATVVNTPAERVRNPVADGLDGSVARQEVKPPLYGAWHTRTHEVERDDVPQWWLAGLNLNPRYRGAAGYGAEVVRKNQEDYVDASWEQVGQILETERQFNLTRLAIEAQQRLKAKHFDALPPARQLQLLAPALARIEALGGDGQPTFRINGATATLGGQLARSSLPTAMVDVAMRRSTSPLRRHLRSAALRQRGGVARAGLGALGGQYLQTMAQATLRPAAFQVNAFVPDGVVATTLFDGVALEGANVRLPERGLEAPVATALVSRLAEAGKAATVRAARGVGAPPIARAQKGGVFTDVHVARFGALVGAAAGAPQAPGAASWATVAQQVEVAGRRGVEGFLIEAQKEGGQLQMSALQLDARSGSFALAKPLLRVGPQGAVTRAAARDVARAAGLALGSMPAADAKRFGNLGLLVSLPANAIDLQGGNTGVRFTLGEGLALQRVGDAPPERNVVSVTLPPALRQAKVLNAFSAATRAAQAAWRDPFHAMRVAVQVVDFPLASVAQVASARIAPARTLGARLAAQVSIAQAALGQASPFVGTHLAVGAGKLRYGVPKLVDRVMAWPHLNEPMYRALAQMDPEAFMPGIGNLPPDLIMLTRVNQHFIDAFMAGANVEMNRELLWRGFPTDQRGTPFQRFWGRLGVNAQGRLMPLPDMAPMHEWGREPLGERTDPNMPDPNRIALIIKGRLLLRYPNAAIYAWKRNKSAGANDSQLRKGPDGGPINRNTDIQMPVFAGFIAPDITFFGFDIDVEDIGDWCFVVEEHMSEPRFGFDVDLPAPDAPPRTIGAKPRAALDWVRQKAAVGAAPDAKYQALLDSGFSPWKAVSWSHLAVAPGGHVGPAALGALAGAAAPFANFPALSATPTSAEIAQALLQQPFRAYWVGPDLAP